MLGQELRWTRSQQSEIFGLLGSRFGAMLETAVAKRHNPRHATLWRKAALLRRFTVYFGFENDTLPLVFRCQP